MRRVVELEGPRALTESLQEGLDAGHLHLRDFSIKQLTESYMGRDWVEELNPATRSGRMHLTEADGSAVAYSDFVGITGQIFFTEVKKPYDAEDIVFTPLVTSKQTTIADMEKFATISNVGDAFSVIGEGEEYPNFGVSQDYQHRAALEKRGGKIMLTKEAILFDKTGLLESQCNKLREYLALNLEKRVIDALIDENAGAKSAVLGGHRYHWNDTSYATFQSSSPWVNVISSGNSLTDWTSLQAAWLKLVAITDPYTGEPIRVKAKHLVVTPQNVMTAQRILRATNVQTHVGGYATSGNLQDMHANAPIQEVIGNLKTVSSQLLAARLATDTHWILGDIGEALRRAYAWEIAPEEAPKFTSQSFDRDIVNQYKISVMDRVFVWDPRYLVESRA